MLRIIGWIRYVLLLLSDPVVPKAIAACTIIYLTDHSQLANIDLMILAGFCRNCLSKWLMAAAEENNVPMDYDQARAHVYCMPYEQWKNTHQLPATDAQVSAFSAIEKAKKLAKI